MLPDKPKISVVMSVYNGAAYVGDAIDSVLNQTYEDFEFIIINDGSTDKTSDIIDSYTDPRIRKYPQKNKGLVPSLNRGLSLAKGEFIARHDADDISHPDRFALQVKYLEDHPRASVVGSSIEVMNSSGKITHHHRVLANNQELKQELLVRSPFAHGSVMMRSSALSIVGEYNADFWPAEDYELWIRLATTGTFYNIDECLYVYREHAESISSSNLELQKSALIRCQEKAWKNKESLLNKGTIDFSAYKAAPDGRQRIDRIVSNISVVNKKATKAKEYRFALKNTHLIVKNPLIYRRLAGTIRRKMVGK